MSRHQLHSDIYLNYVNIWIFLYLTWDMRNHMKVKSINNSKKFFPCRLKKRKINLTVSIKMKCVIFRGHDKVLLFLPLSYVSGTFAQHSIHKLPSVHVGKDRVLNAISWRHIINYIFLKWCIIAIPALFV
jgi:hypothetical protein